MVQSLPRQTRSIGFVSGNEASGSSSSPNRPLIDRSTREQDEFGRSASNDETKASKLLMEKRLRGAVPLMIAVDGPAAAGKSVLARRLADALGYTFFDSGVLYRAITWAALRRGINPSDESTLAELAASLDIRIERAPDGADQPTRIVIDGKDVTNQLFQPEVDAVVSAVAAHPRVRLQLLPLQRAIARKGHVVMAGRDIGTVVVPDAPLKIFVQASAETRAHRRYAQLRRQGVDIDYATVLAEIERRDRLDSGRRVAPMAVATDAIVLDTDCMTLDDEVALILDLIRSERADAP